MTDTQVSSARKFAIAAFSGMVALSLMLPTQLAFASYSVGEQDYSGEEDNSGEGSEGGTWSYTAEGQQMTLVDYVGESIRAVDQDLNVQLEGDNTVNGGISVGGGDLTITGDDSVYGKDKPSLTVNGRSDEINFGSIYAGGTYSGEDNAVGGGNLTIKDANIYANSERLQIGANQDVTIQDSGVYKNDSNKSLTITTSDGNMLLKGSEINADGVHSENELTIDNTNLTVIQPEDWAEEYASLIEHYKKEYGYDYKWLEHAVTAIKITLKGEANGEVIDAVDAFGKAYQYLTTGSDDKIELKASATPAYWGPTTKGMPATGDTAMPLAAGLGITAAFALLLSAYSIRMRKER